MRVALAALGFGAGFGFVLAWARLHDPDVIDAMLRLRELDVFLLMGAAIVTGALGTRLLRAGGVRAWADGRPVAWRTVAPRRAHVIGAAIFGLGWSLSNACPGPVAVQIGRGEMSGLFTAVGLLAGIAARDALTARTAARSPAPPVETAMTGAGSAARG